MTKTQFESFPEKDRMNRILEGTAYWTWVQSPKISEKYNTKSFETVLGLDAANYAKALSYGLKVNPPYIHPTDAAKSINEPHVIIKRKVKPGIADADVKPVLVDSMQKPLPDDLLIGNGSKITVKFGTYWYEAQGGGVGTAFFKMQLNQLVKYTPKGESDFKMDPTGYQVEPETTSAFDAD